MPAPRKRPIEQLAESLAGNWMRFSPPYIWPLGLKPRDPADWTVQRLFDPSAKKVNLSQVYAVEWEMDKYTKGTDPDAKPLQMSSFAFGWAATWGVRCFDRRFVLLDVTGAFVSLVQAMGYLKLPFTMSVLFAPKKKYEASAYDRMIAQVTTILNIEKVAWPMVEAAKKAPPHGWPTLAYYYMQLHMPEVIASVDRGVAATPTKDEAYKAVLQLMRTRGGGHIPADIEDRWIVDTETAKGAVRQQIREALIEQIGKIGSPKYGENVVDDDNVPADWAEQIYDDLDLDDTIDDRVTKYIEEPATLPGMEVVTGRYEPESAEEVLEDWEIEASDVYEALQERGWYQDDDMRAEREREQEEESRVENFHDKTRDKGIDDRIEDDWLKVRPLGRGWKRLIPPVHYDRHDFNQVADLVYRWLLRNMPGQVDDDGESEYAMPDDVAMKRALKAFDLLDPADSEYDDIDDDIDASTKDLVGGQESGSWYNENLADDEEREPSAGQMAVDSTIYVDTDVMRKVPRAEVEEALRRHLSGNFGQVVRQEREVYQENLAGMRGTVKSVHDMPHGRVRITTDAAHLGTFVALPKD